jgi:hypothetical protein
MEIVLTLMAISLLSFIVIMVGENYVEKLSDKSTFKKWWRNNIISPEPKDKI